MGHVLDPRSAAVAAALDARLQLIRYVGRADILPERRKVARDNLAQLDAFLAGDVPGGLLGPSCVILGGARGP